MDDVAMARKEEGKIDGNEALAREKEARTTIRKEKVAPP